MGGNSSKNDQPVFFPYTSAKWATKLSFNQRIHVFDLINLLKFQMRSIAGDSHRNEYTEELLAIYGALLDQLDDKTILLNKHLNHDTRIIGEDRATHTRSLYPDLDLPSPPSY